LKKLLVIDNYDSFTYNLVQMFMQFDLFISVYRNDKVNLNEISALSPDYILISPGPRTPAYSGISIPLVMGIQHSTYPLHGIQFHPESFMTQEGYIMIENFLKLERVKDE